jgi:hypothetical protein
MMRMRMRMGMVMMMICSCAPGKMCPMGLLAVLQSVRVS